MALCLCDIPDILARSRGLLGIYVCGAQDMSECIIREYARVAVSAARVFAKALLIFANDSATYHAALQTKFRILCQETTGSFVAEERRESKDQDHHFVPSDSDSDDDHWFEL